MKLWTPPPLRQRLLRPGAGTRNSQRGWVMAPYRYGATTDPFWTDVVLLLHCDGTDGSSTFVDSSSTPKTVTAQAGAVLATASPMRGSAYGVLSGGGARRLDVSSHTDLAFPGDFTVEMLLRRTVDAGFNAITFSAANWNIYWVGSPSSLNFWDGAANRIVSGSSVSADVSHHIALCRSGTSVRLFLDGVQVGSTYTNSGPTSLGAGGVRVGGYPSSGTPSATYLGGDVDEIRITRAARYTANFTPPTGMHPDG
mgnify:CR=1 FL=1